MPHVVVIEDEPAIAELCPHFLAEEETRVSTVPSLAAGRALGTRSPAPALVLVDRGLPDGDGVAFCREVGLRWPTVPRVLMTGFLPDLADTAAADEVLLKPFAAAESRAIVQQPFGRSAARAAERPRADGHHEEA
jgi:DNA-binding response OmpR family regulator